MSITGGHGMSKNSVQAILYLACAVSLISWSGCSSERASIGNSTTATPSTQVSITVDPAAVSLPAGQQQQFTATVSNLKDVGVTWWVNDVLGGASSFGTISSSGLYTAPSMPSANPVTIKAVSQSDMTKSGAATLTVTAASDPNTSIVPVPNACRTATAQSGCIDTTFGSSGFVITNIPDLGSGSIYPQEASNIIQQSDGKLIAIGTSDDFGMVRYHPDGSLDTSFGTGGIINNTLPIATEEGAAAIDASGNILILGYSELVRLTPTGVIDNAWGSSGIVPLGSCRSTAIALQPDGKIVVAGSDSVCRFNADGTMDNTFGSGGLAAVPAATGTSGGINALRLETIGGKDFILGGGQLGPNWSFGLVRLTSDGGIDSTFGTGGQVVLFPDVEGWVSSVVLDPKQNILAAAVVTGHGSFVLARFTPDGILDTTFGDPISGSTTRSGIAVVSVRGTTSINRSNKTLAFGTVDGATKIYYSFGTGITPYDTPSYFGLARFDSAGTIDKTFGGVGVVAADFGEHLNSGHAIIVQSSGEIVEAGGTWTRVQGNSFGLVRFWP